MTSGQRISFAAIAAVIAVVAVIVLGTADSEDPVNTAQPPTATPAATSSATSEPEEASPIQTETPTPEPLPVLRAGSDQQLRFKEGERVRFKVRSSQADHVHVHGYDLFKDVGAGKTVTFSFEATITGIFEVELEDSHTPLGTLRVDPR